MANLTADLRQRLREYAHRLGLPAFWRWWTGQLAPLVPAVPRAALKRRMLRPVLAFAQDVAVLWVPRTSDGALAASACNRACSAVCCNAMTYVRFCQIGNRIATSATSATSASGTQTRQRRHNATAGRSVSGSRLSLEPPEIAGPLLPGASGVTATTVAPQLSARRRASVTALRRAAAQSTRISPFFMSRPTTAASK